MAETVGEIVCGCGRRAYIQKTARKGDYLQKRCGTGRADGCGLDQSTGEWVQQFWRENMVPVGTLVAGVDYTNTPKQVKPQVTDLEPDLPAPETTKKTTEQPQVTDLEPDLAQQPSEPQQNRESGQDSSGLTGWQIFAGLAAIGLGLVGIRFSVN